MITARALKNAPDVLELYRAFLDREDERSGTVVLHHGRVKRPGKHVPDFRSVELQPLASDVEPRLARLAEAAKERYGLNQVLLVHRLGTVAAEDTVLVAIVSAETRDRCFDGCRFLVDEVKKEEIIRLIERP
ncbi:MAG: molybdenum cofactor biosynthesis protein MoaE [Deltaproteobacteria bacterium]|nr:molybdenum cofactor biosynthesis protein MoaE [Deltaproteobacteria bacterium]